MKFERAWIAVTGASLIITLAALFYEAVEVGQVSYIPWLWSYGLMHESGDRVLFIASIVAVLGATFIRSQGGLFRIGVLTLSGILLVSSICLLFEVVLAGRTDGWLDAVFYAFRYANERVITYLTPMAASLTALLVVATGKVNAAQKRSRTA